MVYVWPQGKNLRITVRHVEDGNVCQLREFINVTDADWPLAVAWLLAAIRPIGPYPILPVNGEQGSCKTTTCCRLRSVVDPNSVPLRDVPKNEQTLMIWAKNSHVIALDNLSSLSKDLSNAMCRLATGGGHSEKTNYSDASETLFYACRPQMLNGIGDIATRSDFLDRSLPINLPIMPKSARKTEKELDTEFAKVHASIFGALLTAASHGLKRLPEVEKLDIDLPRLADFANWMMAVETALGWEEGTFLTAMNRNESQSHELAISESLVVDKVRKFLEQAKHYDGGWETLLKELNKLADAKTKRSRRWPKNSRALSTRLRERAPNLRGLGYDVEFHDKERPKRVTLKAPQAPPQPQELQGAGDLSSYYRPCALATCYGDGDSLAEMTLAKLIRFWSTLPDSGVAESK